MVLSRRLFARLLLIWILVFAVGAGGQDHLEGRLNIGPRDPHPDERAPGCGEWFGEWAHLFKFGQSQRDQAYQFLGTVPPNKRPT